jgi:extracellular factor (EF) 3-hydroxypalmitic acid methyl ester biosynthesis protein
MFYPCGMSQALNVSGNGNGHGSSSVLTKPTCKPATPPSADAANESQVSFQTADGLNLHGVPTNFTRLAAVFEVYGGAAVLRASEVLENFRICIQGQVLYAGKAVVHNVVSVSAKVICEVTLAETNWQAVDDVLSLGQPEKIRAEFNLFLKDWQKFYKVSREFKEVVADMQTFLYDLRLWLDKVGARIELQPSPKREELERKFLTGLCEPAMQAFAALFEKFERLAAAAEPASRLSCNLYAKRALHPLVLCSPFMHRTYAKPLGYAGDYEMVRMMTLDPFQGNSLYAKILNTFFLNTPPVVAHRNRIDTLVKYLQAETLRATQKGRRAKVFNLGCGPAAEIQRFMRDVNWSSLTDFTLLDFNDETVAFAQRTMTQIRNQNDRKTGLEVIKKSVVQLLKNSSKFKLGSYDLVYCAGLFDYLSDNVCTRLLEVFYELVAPGGLVLVSNVDACNPSRGWMECMVDWFLVYRDANKMREIIPTEIAKDSVHVFSEPSSVNIFAEIRKPLNG